MGKGVNPEDACTPFPLLVRDAVENLEQTVPLVPIAIPVISPGSDDLCSTAEDVRVCHCVHGHAIEFLMKRLSVR